jgi:PIN domain
LKNNYVLIDFENVQPKNLAILNGHEFKVIVFVGSNQAKVPFDLACALQAFGNNAEYIKIGGNGPNALDFHIAFYIGQLAEKDPNAYFHIISKDAGFDPLIKHLKERKIFAQRERDLTEISLLRISNVTSAEEKLGAIVKSLAARGHSRPRKVKTLTNTINALFSKTLEDTELMDLIEEMKKRSLIVVENETVNYRPPISQP